MTIKALKCRIVFSLALLLASQAGAAPTAEQMKQLIETKDVPVWQTAIEQIKTARGKVTDAGSQARWRMLDGMDEQFNSRVPLDVLLKFSSRKDAWDIATWLRWKILAGNGDPRFSYMYAAYLHYLPNPNGTPIDTRTAAIFLYHARLALHIDGARCADPASAQNIRLSYESQGFLKPLLDKVRALSNTDQTVAVLEAIAIEETLGERPRLPLLCQQGTQAVMRALSAGQQPMPAPADAEKGRLGRPVRVDTSAIEPDWVPDDQWRAKRREILDSELRKAVKDL